MPSPTAPAEKVSVPESAELSAAPIPSGPDFFALLNLARDPCLSPANIESAFDRCLRTSPEQQAELLAARDCLLDPLARLSHLLELLGGSPKPSTPTQTWPGGNLGWEIQQTLASTQRILDLGCPQSGLPRALWRNQLRPLQEQLQNHLTQLAPLFEKIHGLFAVWPELSTDARVNLLCQTIPSLQYAHRWKTQLEETLFALRLLEDT
jgi:hypothetical protein